MSWATIVAKLNSDLSAISNIGNVHSSPRWTVFDDEFINRFTKEINGQREVRFWLITRDNVGSAYGPGQNLLGTQVSLPTSQELRRHDVIIDGFMGMSDNEDDTTEDDFQSLVDSVIDALSDRTSFDDVVLIRSTDISAAIDIVEFSEVLTHHVTIQFYVVEKNNITPS